jgi:hypothetical protein
VIESISGEILHWKLSHQRGPPSPPIGLGFLVALLVAALGGHTVLGGRLSSAPLVRVSGRSPFVNCTADRVRAQRGNNYLASEVEPYLVVNPQDPDNLVGTWQQDRWSNGGARGLVAAVSRDGGETWRRVVVPGISKCSGGSFSRASDPWLSFAPNGTLYHISLSSSAAQLGPSALLVNKSSDGGLTWSEPITIVEDTDPTALHDKESITADPTDADLVYAAWDRFNRIGKTFRAPFYFSRSTDGGERWEEARRIFDPGLGRGTLGHQIIVHPDGTLIDFFTLTHRRFLLTVPRLLLLRSPNRGITWGPGDGPIIASEVLPAGVIDPESRRSVRTGDVLADVAVDPTSGNLYAVWQDGRFSFFNHDAIAFSMSTNGGLSWSTPIKINRTPARKRSLNKQAFTPSVAVAADGTIGVSYYDFRHNDRRKSLRTEYFLVHCHPPTSSCAQRRGWHNEIRLTDRPFDLRRAPFARGYFVGDYEGLATANDDFLAFFSRAHARRPPSVFFRRTGPTGTGTPRKRTERRSARRASWRTRPILRMWRDKVRRPLPPPAHR